MSETRATACMELPFTLFSGADDVQQGLPALFAHHTQGALERTGQLLARRHLFAMTTRGLAIFFVSGRQRQRHASAGSFTDAIGITGSDSGYAGVA